MKTLLLSLVLGQCLLASAGHGSGSGSRAKSKIDTDNPMAIGNLLNPANQGGQPPASSQPLPVHRRPIERQRNVHHPLVPPAQRSGNFPSSTGGAGAAVPMQFSPTHSRNRVGNPHAASASSSATHARMGRSTDLSAPSPIRGMTWDQIIDEFILSGSTATDTTIRWVVSQGAQFGIPLSTMLVLGTTRMGKTLSDLTAGRDAAKSAKQRYSRAEIQAVVDRYLQEIANSNPSAFTRRRDKAAKLLRKRAGPR